MVAKKTRPKSVRKEPIVEYDQLPRDARCTVLTVEVVLEGDRMDLLEDVAHEMESMLDGFRSVGAAEIIKDTLVRGGFDDVCGVLSNRHQAWRRPSTGSKK